MAGLLGLAPLGALTIGALAEATSVHVALAFGGLACAAARSQFLRRRKLVRAALRVMTSARGFG